MLWSLLAAAFMLGGMLLMLFTAWVWSWAQGFPDPVPDPPSYWSFGGSWVGVFCAIAGVAGLVVANAYYMKSVCTSCGLSHDPNAEL